VNNEAKPVIRCAVYTRKSCEEGLEQSFNSLDAQREACEAFILSQRHEAGESFPLATTTAATRVEIWTARTPTTARRHCGPEDRHRRGLINRKIKNNN